MYKPLYDLRDGGDKRCSWFSGLQSGKVKIRLKYKGKNDKEASSLMSYFMGSILPYPLLPCNLSDDLFSLLEKETNNLISGIPSKRDDLPIFWMSLILLSENIEQGGDGKIKFSDDQMIDMLQKAHFEMGAISLVNAGLLKNYSFAKNYRGLFDDNRQMQVQFNQEVINKVKPF